MNKIKFNRCLRQFRKGNLSYLETIYNEYYNKFVITANQILHNYALSEDVASDVLEKIIQYAQNNERPQIGHPGAYLYSSVRNLAKDVYRRNKWIDSYSEISEDVVTEEKDVAEYFYLEQLFSSLDENEYDIAVMKYYYGYKIREISLALNMPEGTVKWKLTEIKKKVVSFIEKN